MEQYELVVRGAGGLCTTKGLAEAGVGARALRDAVRNGTLVRPRRGFYASVDARPDAVVAVRSGGRLAGVSAAATFGLWGGWHPEILHLTVLSSASRVSGRPTGQRPAQRVIEGRICVVHWNDDRRDGSWCWRVSLDRCLRQVVRWEDEETWTAVIETALTKKLIDEKDLSRIGAGASAGRARRVEACRGGSQSGVESIARLRLERLGLALVQQHQVPGVGHVDLRVVGTNVLIETDGFEFHSSGAQFAEDRRRDAEATARGFTTLRFTALQVRDRWSWVERMVLAAVAGVS
jgi:very-short-patch-repair endonuclease